ncbi:MAG: hypothetical protein FJ388_23380, partial [Verrucomicrobia bacterium]|nr:hypothetical protein [Verrucomicrobiota bacterium]
MPRVSKKPTPAPAMISTDDKIIRKSTPEQQAAVAAAAEEKVRKAITEGGDIHLGDLQRTAITSLYKIARELNIEGVGVLKKHEVIFKILEATASKTDLN